MIPPDIRSKIVLMHEGQVLNLAGSTNSEHGGVVAQCVIDGAMNALIRLQGREAAAQFAFALGDRVAGGLKQPTELPVPTAVEAPVEASPAPQPAPSERKLLMHLYWYLMGCMTVFTAMGGWR